jgi:hypothetical protein
MFAMFGAVKLFWVGLPGPVRKVAVYVLIGIAALYLLRLHDNQVAARSRIEARQELTKDLVKAHEKELQLVKDSFIAERKQNDEAAIAMRLEYSNKFVELQKRVDASTTKLQTNIKTIDEERKLADEKLSHISDDSLDEFLRIQSRKLAGQAATVNGH